MKDEQRNERLRSLPGVGAIIGSKFGKQQSDRYGQGITAHATRRAISEVRRGIETNREAVYSEADIEERIQSRLSALCSEKGRSVINATGIVLHTGLGRAPLSNAAGTAIRQATGYSLVETDRVSGERSRREVEVEALLRDLCGCEAATVVNNCAGAIFLALAAIASPGKVLISRGELVEIGGSFRMPDVMQASGCVLQEVGTTNRTTVKDFAQAISDDTSAILRVSQSNFRIRGFTSSVSLDELTSLGKEKNIPVLYDLGGGALVDLERWGLRHETTVREAIEAGASVVCFSGDKLIGGPQAGILCGKKDFIEKIRKNIFFRMLRPDKLTLSALEATLISFLNERFEKEIPVFQILSRRQDEMLEAGTRIFEALSEFECVERTICEDSAHLGGGSLPDEALPSLSLRITYLTKDERLRNRWANSLAKELRLSQPAVFCRIEAGGILLNFRTIFPEEIETLAHVLREAIVDTSEKLPRR